MSRRVVVAVVAALFVGLWGVPADAQSAKGVKVTKLVTSVGVFGGWGKIKTDLLVSGSTVELAGGGQTGREKFLVPTFIYVIEGILTTEFDPGPVARGGIHYFAAGQSHMETTGLWHNFKNASPTKPVKYLLVHVGYPGAKTIKKAKKAE
ncbi:MAG: hypothetical protein ACE5JD_03155 [Candidatus Methylomirabilia bacterium]